MVDRDKDIRENRSGQRKAEAVVEPGGVTRGASWSGHERNHYWKNMEGKDFLEMSGISHADVSWDSRSFSLLDFDHDGFQDFVMVNANRPLVQLFRNRFGELLPEAQRGRAIYVRLEGGNHGPDPNPEWSNRDGIGAKVLVDLGDRTLLREYRCGEGLGAQNSATMYIGIGNLDRIPGIQVLWPSGRVTDVPSMPAGSLAFVRERAEPGKEAIVGRLKPLAPRASSHVVDQAEAMGHSPELKRLLENQTDAKYRLVMSWFTTCVACKKADPTLAAMRAAFSEEELGVFGFNNSDGDSRKEMEKYREKWNPSFVPLLDRTEDDIEAFKKLQDQLLKPYRPAGEKNPQPASELTPGCFLLDAEGRVLDAWIGVPSVSELKRKLSSSR